MFFQVWEKWYFQSEFPPFTVRAAWRTLALRVALQIFIEKRPESGVFLVENWKHLGHWSGTVSYVSLSIKTTVEGRLKKTAEGEQNRTRRKLNLYFLSDIFLSCLILLKFIHFQLYIPYNIPRFLCHFVVCSGVFWHFRISERHEIKGWKNDKCLSMYVLNKIPYGKCFVPCSHKTHA